MARPLRVEVPGGLYHVIVRGNERRAVFRDDADRTKYLERLAHYREKWRGSAGSVLLDGMLGMEIATSSSQFPVGAYPLNEALNDSGHR